MDNNFFLAKYPLATVGHNNKYGNTTVDGVAAVS